MKILIVYFMIALCSFPITGQNTRYGDLYIKYISKNGDAFNENDNGIRFYLEPGIDASYFVYDKKNIDHIAVDKKQIEDQLISKAQANKKVMSILKKEAAESEKKTGIKGHLYTQPPYFFDDIFDNIYVFVPDSTGEKGTLYPVSWRYAIE